MICTRLPPSTFVTICLTYTWVVQTLAVPLARNPDPSLRTYPASSSQETNTIQYSDPQSEDNTLTVRQASSSSPEVFVYYGQVLSSPGASLTDICADPNIDKVALAFLTSFSDTAGFPVLSIGKNCPSSNAAQTAAGATGLHDCVTSGLAKEVAACQRAGKPVLLSLGGGAATNMIIPSQDAAQRYAHSIWDLFLGNAGNTDVRPFGSVILDGIDIDIEHGSGTYLIDFVIALRKLTDAATASTGRRYYLTAAPQCSDLITSTSTVPATTIPWLKLAPYLDSVMVQFYNNPTCDFTSTSLFTASLSAWSAELAKTAPVAAGIAPGSSRPDTVKSTSPNYQVVTVDGLSTRSEGLATSTSSDVISINKRAGMSASPKLLIGITATSEVGSGYLPMASLGPVLQQIGTEKLPNLAGAMFWDGVWCMGQSTSTTTAKSFQQIAKSALKGNF